MESAQSPPSSTAPCWVTNQKPKPVNQRPAGERDGLEMKVRDMAGPVTSAICPVSQRLKEKIRCHLSLMLKKAKHDMLSKCAVVNCKLQKFIVVLELNKPM